MTSDDPERELILTYAPAAGRAALAAVLMLDDALAKLLRTTREPAVGQIRLAWWREALERLDASPPPAEPVLQALAAHVLPAGITGADLSAMEEGWLMLLSDDALTDDDLARYAALRGGLLFALTARLLGDSEFSVARAGEAWALADLARHSRRAEEIKSPPPESQVKWLRKLRPLGMLAMLARRDLERIGREPERQGSPARMLRMIRHRLSGY